MVLTQLGHGDNTADGMDVVTIYAPADPTLRTRFYLDLTETLMQRPDANKSLIVMGDWNLVPDARCRHDAHGGADINNVGERECEAFL